MNSTMVIKILNQQDSLKFKELRLLSFQESPFSFSESYEDECNKSITEFENDLYQIGNPIESFVIGIFTESSELIGIAKFKRDTRTKAKHKAMIHAFYILPEYRKKGLGKRLMINLLKKAKAISGLEQIHLWVLISNDSALKFYEKCGFVTQGSEVKNDLKINDQYVDAVYMVNYIK